jgi:LemA protein
MAIVGYTFLVLVFIVLIYGIISYNRLVVLRNNVKKAWGNIDVLLKQRHDELPKLVAVCKEYMQHEQVTLERVISARGRIAQARAAGDMGALGVAEGTLRTGLGQLFALVENYPELKANENFQHLRARISSLENAIADRREFYNLGFGRVGIRKANSYVPTGG